MTLNQAIQQLKEIAQSHSQLRSFYFGEPYNWPSLTLEYPACLITQEGVRLLNGALEIDFSIWLADRIFQTEEDVNKPELKANSIEVQSDMLLVLEDLISAIENPDLDWMQSQDSIQIEMYSDNMNDDQVAGCKGDFTIRFEQPKDRCIIP
jgi:hypothetical protein